MKLYLAGDVRNSVLGYGVKRIVAHECSICGHEVGYVIKNGEPFFDGSCGCPYTAHAKGRKTWQSMADWLNIQPTIEAQNEIAKRMMLYEPPPPPVPLTVIERIRNVVRRPDVIEAASTMVRISMEAHDSERPTDFESLRKAYKVLDQARSDIGLDKTVTDNSHLVAVTLLIALEDANAQVCLLCKK